MVKAVKLFYFIVSKCVEGWDTQWFTSNYLLNIRTCSNALTWEGGECFHGNELLPWWLWTWTGAAKPLQPLDIWAQQGVSSFAV